MLYLRSVELELSREHETDILIQQASAAFHLGKREHFYFPKVKLLNKIYDCKRAKERCSKLTYEVWSWSCPGKTRGMSCSMKL